MATCELDELLRPLNDGAAFGRGGDGDAPAAAELEQTLVAQDAQRTQHGVRVDTEDGGEILRGWESLARLRLSFGDRPAELAGDLLVEIRRVVPVQLDIQHGASRY